MARPREFDRDTALTKAMYLFWKQGYEATSVQSLGHHLGLHPGSLYNTFRDKHSLFLEALDRYSDIESERLGRLLHGADVGGVGRAALRCFFQLVVEADCADPDRKGCLMINSMAELAALDADVRTKVTANRTKLEHGLYQVIIQAQQRGEINLYHNAHALAAFLVTTLFGLRLTAKVSSDCSALMRIVDVALTTLD